jgi:SSS family transporter
MDSIAISNYDLMTLAFYFVFMATIGIVTRKFVNNTSDYFRGGGQMLWWMTGAAAFMTQFSAWSFTGAASKAYTDGPIILTIYFANALGFAFNYLYFAPKFRQLRVITPVEAVERRFGRASEQFFTWSFIPTNILYAGIWLNGLAIFFSSVFNFPLEKTIIATGILVLFNATMGGSWAVMTSDFMQTMLLMLIALTTAIFSLVQIGGPVALVEKFPTESVLGNDFNYPLLIIVWIILVFFKQFCSTNNVMEASRYLSAKDSVNAKKAALMAAILFVVGPVLWFIPPMVAAVIHPDLSVVFPTLDPGKASEAAYVAAALDVLPVGMMGLLMAGMFAATISSMDGGLNRNSGIFVKNFYRSILRPDCSDKEQMIVSKIVTVFLGLCIIASALFFSSLKNLTLFDIMLQFGSLVALPISIPLILGVVVKKTPGWSGWSTVLVGLVCSIIVNQYLNGAWFSEIFGLNFTNREINEYDAGIGILVNITIPVAYFYFTAFFYKEPEGKRKEVLELYWENLATPVVAEKGKTNDGRQGKLLGTLAGVYGTFILLLSLIPNPVSGRIAFVLCGLALMGVGALLYFSYQKAAKENR